VVDAREAHIDSYLLGYIRTKPGLGFSGIVRSAQLECAVSRATAARHLSRLVRFGEVTLLPNRTYVLGETAGSGPRPTVEVRWAQSTELISADGTCWSVVEQEYRVISGTLDHFDFLRPKPHRHFVWWSTSPSHWVRIPQRRSQGHHGTHRVEFDPPLTSRNATWQRMSLTEEFPREYRMAQSAGASRRRPTSSREDSEESESLEVGAQRSNFGQRLARDARLRLQLVFPEGYPVGAVRCRVNHFTTPDRVDTEEQQRVEALGELPSHSDGLRHSGSTISLSIPRPKLDRRYEIRWGLPTPAQRTRWLAGQHRP
jgi:hypothetical protein